MNCKVRRIRAGAVFAFALFLAATLTGCGGGGGGATQVTSTQSQGVYSLISPASRDIGTATSTVSTGDATLSASLAETTNVTISERFYTSGRPEGVVGKIYDIKPDGLAFRSGTKLCISYDNIDDDPDELTIVTGEGLDQVVASSADYGKGAICAELSHSSPYGLNRVRNLETPASTVFGDMHTKEDYKYAVKTYSETDSELGALSVVKISVYCNLKCIESGDRIFKVASNGDLYIDESGAYSLWGDLDQLKWIHLRNDEGGIVAGIPYFLASAYLDYYMGGGPLSGAMSTLDPSENFIKRFFYKEGAVSPYLYLEIARNDSTQPGVITMKVNRTGDGDRSYTINQTTAAITKYISNVEYTSATPGDTGYTTLNNELLGYIYILVGIEDTPDYTAGNAYDEYPRYSPNQELFAVNVMNLLKGYGWNNMQQIEVYYRDRQQAATDTAH